MITKRTIKKIAVAVFAATAIFYFLPIPAPHKIAIPVFSLFIAGLRLLPWQMCAAMLFSALGDYAGSCHDFIWQMGLFAAAHIFMISFFVKIILDSLKTSGKGTKPYSLYIGVAAICIWLLTIAFQEIVPFAPAGTVRIGVMVYAILIITMLSTSITAVSIKRPYDYWFSLCSFGAGLFLISDGILAWNKFVTPLPHSGLLIMVPYYLAQLSLFLGASRAKAEK